MFDNKVKTMIAVFL